MKPVKCLFLVMALVVCYGSAIAQTPYPAKWRYNLKRSANNEYELIFHLSLNRGWHIRTQDDGDTLLHAPEFAFTHNDALELKGNVLAKGISERVKVDSVGAFDVYSYNVLYIQKLAAKPGTKVTGKYTYQLCNDKKVLPVKTEKFAFIMK